METYRKRERESNSARAPLKTEENRIVKNEEEEERKRRIKKKDEK